MAAGTHQPENGDDFESCLDAPSGMLSAQLPSKRRRGGERLRNVFFVRSAKSTSTDRVCDG
jgi:hypothetical protein